MKTAMLYETTFEASHSLSKIPGEPGLHYILHGHTWRVLVEVGGEVDEISGMIMDPKKLEEMVQACLPFGHLNQIISNPTAELVARYILMLVQTMLRADSHGAVEIVALTLFEGVGKGVRVCMEPA